MSVFFIFSQLSRMGWTVDAAKSQGHQSKGCPGGVHHHPGAAGLKLGRGICSLLNTAVPTSLSPDLTLIIFSQWSS